MLGRREEPEPLVVGDLHGGEAHSERHRGCTVHKNQTVYHGAVAYLDDPQRCLESAASELELALLLVFRKPATRYAQRE